MMGKSLNCWCSKKNPNAYQCFSKSRDMKPRAKVFLFREGKMEQTEVAEHSCKGKHRTFELHFGPLCFITCSKDDESVILLTW